MLDIKIRRIEEFSGEEKRRLHERSLEDLANAIPTAQAIVENIQAPMLYAARRVGIDKIFKAGGAEAIAAMALGTESIPKVHKIFGAGNVYVNAAKLVVQANPRLKVTVDMPAGPSENFIVADE